MHRDLDRSTAQTTQLLGTLGIVGAPLLFIENALFGFGAQESAGPFALLGMLYMLGWLCSIVGLWRLSATGAGIIGKAILAIMMVGLALAAVNNLILATSPAPDRESLLFIVTDLAWPLSHLYMLVVGIAVAVARRLAGWRRWMPLLCGLAFPFTLIAQTLLGLMGLNLAAEYYAIIPAALLLLLGYAVRSAGEQPVPAATAATSLSGS